jgi:type III secretory pathway component EscV
MLLLFLSAGGETEVTVGLTVGRVVFTVIGVILAIALAWGMERWDERSGLVAAGEPGQPG